MAANYFSIELGEYYIKIADVTKKSDFFEVSGLALIPTDKAIFATDIARTLEDQGKKIARKLEELKISKKNVNVILPDSLSYNQVIEMPRLNERELKSAIKYQADQFIPMPIDEVSLDVEILYEFEVEKKILALISAAPKKIIEKVQSVIEYAGLVPNSIEPEISASGRFMAEVYKKTDEINNRGQLFINIGYGGTSLYYYNDHLKLITQAHSFNIGYELFVKEIELNLNVDEGKAIELLAQLESSPNLQGILGVVIKSFLTELQRFSALLSGKYQYSIESIFLFNEVVRIPYLRKVVEEFFKTPITVYDLTSLTKKGANVDAVKDKLSYFLSVFGGNLR